MLLYCCFTAALLLFYFGCFTTALFQALLRFDSLVSGATDAALLLLYCCFIQALFS
jgi:hypothetical protein